MFTSPWHMINMLSPDSPSLMMVALAAKERDLVSCMMRWSSSASRSWKIKIFL